MLKAHGHPRTLRADLIEVLQHLSLTPAPGCTWYGELFPEEVPAGLPGDLPATHIPAYLTDVLVQRLYEDYYRRGRPAPQSPASRAVRRVDSDSGFVRELSQANRGSGTRQTGWVVTDISQDGTPGTTLSIRRAGLTVQATWQEIVSAGAGMPQPGDDVDLRMPKELPAISPGFYMALGDQPYSTAGQPAVRLYWNIRVFGAAPLVHGLTSSLNGARLPFRLKLVNHPERYNRCDAAVLYLLRQDLDSALPLLARVHDNVRGYVKQPVPAMTKWLAPGLGFAEDPPDGDSFGAHRCRLLASGLVRGWELGAESIDEQLSIVLDTLEAAGIDPVRPYLNPGSQDDYDISLSVPAYWTSVLAAPDFPAPDPSTEDATAQRYLDAAVAIGAEICAAAFWHQSRCNWLGAETRGAGTPAHHGQSYRSLGPAPYDGTSGVALFLAELAITTGDPGARRTALGAIRQALASAGAIDTPLSHGLYTGTFGLALAAARVATLLDAADVLAGARSLLNAVDDDCETARQHDFLSGSAGGIAALLTLADLLEDRSLIDRAAHLGNRLLASAQCDEHGCSWPSPSSPDAPHLTGLSHGAAGIGLALFELWHATANEQFRFAAARAFDYEQRWFNPDEGNWPDFRSVRDHPTGPGAPYPYQAFWCHGAPGIALSRLRAWELTANSEYREQAIVALSTTQRAVRQALHDGTSNYSVCHGLTGIAAILLRGHASLGSSFEQCRDTALQAAAEGIRLYAAPERNWPYGTHGGWSPGLMLGLAGIGRFYLTLSGNSVPAATPPPFA